MTGQQNDKQPGQIVLTEEFDTVTVSAGDISVTIKRGKDGCAMLETEGYASIVSTGIVTASEHGTAQLRPSEAGPANAITITLSKKACNLWDALPDGWFIGPVSPDTGHVMAVKPVSGQSASLVSWNHAETQAAILRTQSHTNARIPSYSEFDALADAFIETAGNSDAHANPCPLNSRYWIGSPEGFTAGDPEKIKNIRRIADFSSPEIPLPWSFRDRRAAYALYVRDEPGITLA